MVRQYIDLDLTRSYKLDLSAKEKPMMNVDDAFLVLYHHWVMDQLSRTGDKGYK